MSDVHCGSNSAQAIDNKLEGPLGVELGRVAGERPIRDTYIENLKSIKAGGSSAHLLIVGGDLMEKGDEAGLREAKLWLDRAKAGLGDHAKLESSAPRVLLVGGNHDVNRKATGPSDSPEARHLRFSEAIGEEYVYPDLHTDPEVRSLCRVEYTEAEVEVVLLGSSERGGEPDEDVWHLRELIEETPEIADALDSVLIRYERFDPPLVHQADLQRLKQHHPRTLVKIAVLHHPLSPLPRTELALMAGLANAGEIKQILLDKRYTLVLHGHSHSGWFGEECWPDEHNGHTLRIAGAPTLGSQDSLESPGYNEIELQYEGTSKVTVTVRRFLLRGGSWVPDKSMGSFTASGE